MSNAFDSANYPTTEPSVLVAGDRWAWKRTDLGSDYAPTSYSLKYAARLEGTGTTEIEINATGSGTDYLVEVSKTTTGAYAPGRYRWQAYITRASDSERVMVDSGMFEVKPNRDSATADPRSHARKVLDAIEAVIEQRATRDQMSYMINGRQLSRMKIDDLMMFRDKYRAEVLAEERAESGKGRTKLVMRLSR
jgi:hypothetical protein